MQTVLFDLDGTLIDSLKLILGSYRHTMTVHRGAPLPDALWLRGLGKPLRVQLREIATDDTEARAMLETYREFYAHEHDRLIKPYAGVTQALYSLAQAGVRLGLVTSKMRDNTLRALRTCKLEAYFESVVTADDVPEGKPHPMPVLTAMAELGAKARETWFVGDSPHDMAAGRAAHVKIGGVLWGPFAHKDLAPYKPDAWLEYPSEFTHLVRAREASSTRQQRFEGESSYA